MKGIKKWYPLLLIVIPVGIGLAAQFVSDYAACTYDDLPNVWSCAYTPIEPYMYLFDFFIFVIGYPLVFLGICILTYRGIRKLLSFLLT